MNVSILFRKLVTTIGLVTKGELLKTVMYGETDSQLEKRKKTWERHLITGKPIQDWLSINERLELYPGDRVSERIYKRQFEKDEQEFIRQFLRRGDVFVDAGANIGLYTVIAGKVVGSNGQVYSFEPSYTNFQRLQRNISLNRLKNVEAQRKALSDAVEKRDLTVSSGEYGEYNAWNSLGTPARGDNFETEIVPCTKWDIFAAENDLIGKTTLMKIDVEGWELFVLNGATDVLSKDDAPELLIEFTQLNANNAGISCDTLYRKLETLGYRMYNIDSIQGILIREKLPGKYDYANLLATKRENFVSERSGYDIVG